MIIQCGECGTSMEVSRESLIQIIDRKIDPRSVSEGYNRPKEEIGVLYGKPQSDPVKRTFFEVFNELSGPDGNPVLNEQLIKKLIESPHFPDEGSARTYINKFAREGRIYKTKPNYWVKA